MPLIKRAVLLSLLLFALSESVFSQISDQRQMVAKKFIAQADEVLKSTAAKSVAKELYIQAARIDPENLDANFKAGQLYLQTIDKSRAVPHFKKVMEIDPDYHFSLDT